MQAFLVLIFAGLLPLLKEWCPVLGQVVSAPPQCSPKCPPGKRCLMDNVTIPWDHINGHDYLCDSYKKCYGGSSYIEKTPPTSFFPVRLHPVDIARGSSVFFVSQGFGDISFLFRIFNVPRGNFFNCSKAGGVEVSNGMIRSLRVPQTYFKTLGYKYFITTDNLFVGCHFGFRLHINVKDATNCSGYSTVPPDGRLCSGKGHCLSDSFTSGISCECCQGYSGKYCEEYDSCVASPCHHGNCTDINAGHHDEFVCHCPQGYTGQRCNIDIDDCKTVVCQNGGLCQDGLNSYTCLCPPELYGKHCEFTSTICERITPCQNNGVCVAVGIHQQSYICRCPHGFAGHNCTINATSTIPVTTTAVDVVSITSGTIYGSTTMVSTSIHSTVESDGTKNTKTRNLTATESSITASQISGTKTGPGTIKNTVTHTSSEYGTKHTNHNTKISTSGSPSLAPSMTVTESTASIVNTPSVPATISMVTTPYSTSWSIAPSTTTTVFPSSTVSPPHVNQTCADQPCGMYGTCVDITSSLASEPQFRCDCRYPSVGPICTTDLQLHFSYFNGRSLIKHKPIAFGSTLNQIVISFRTDHDGTILYAGHSRYGDFIKLEVFNGRLKFSFDAGDGVSSVTSASMVTGNMTAAIVTYDSSTGVVTVKVNNNPTSTYRRVQRFRAVDLYQSLYIGGIIPKAFTDNKQVGQITPFIGCIHELEFNDMAIVLEDALDWQNISECDVPACSASPCKNGGTCLPDKIDVNEYSCQCPTSYSGDNCEHKDRCLVNICNGGICLNNTKDGSVPKCLCPFGKGGITCEEDIVIHVPKFTVVDGHSSYLQYISPKGINNQLDIRLEIKPDKDNTTLKSTLLFYVGQHDHLTVGSDSDYLALGIKDKHVLLQYNLGSGPVQIYSKQELTSDQEWFVILAGRKGRDGYVYVDVDDKQEDSSPPPLLGLNVFGHLYLGGIRDPAQLNSEVPFTEGYTGIIQNPKIRSGLSNNWLLLTMKHSVNNDSAEVAVIAGVNVQNENVTACVNGSCANNGTCVSLGASYVCRCPPAWGGMLCKDEAVPCREYNPCEGTSTCRMLANGFTCDCPPGKTGQYCEKDLNITLPYFQDHSFMSFSLNKIYIRFVTSISLRFSPSKENGFLFYITKDIRSHSGDFLSLTLHDRFLYLIFNLGTGVAKCKSVETVNINKTNDVVVTRNMEVGKLEVNGKQVQCKSPNGASALDVASTFYLGGVPDLSQIQPLAYENTKDLRDFSGCIMSLMINQHGFDLNEKTALDGRNIENCPNAKLVF